MDIQTLHDAILADPSAKALADAGNDAGCAAYIATRLPAGLATAYLNERGVVASFANPQDGEAALQGFEAAAQSDPLYARAVRWLSPANGGIDFGNPVTRAMLDSLQAAGALTPASVTTLKAVAEVPAAVAAADVSAAWAQYRPEGRIA